MGSVRYRIIHTATRWWKMAWREGSRRKHSRLCARSLLKGGRLGGDECATDSAFTSTYPPPPPLLPQSYGSQQSLSAPDALLYLPPASYSFSPSFSSPNDTAQILSLCGRWRRPCYTISASKRRKKRKPVNVSSHFLSLPHPSSLKF